MEEPVPTIEEIKTPVVKCRNKDIMAGVFQSQTYLDMMSELRQALGGQLVFDEVRKLFESARTSKGK